MITNEYWNMIEDWAIEFLEKRNFPLRTLPSVLGNKIFITFDTYNSYSAPVIQVTFDVLDYDGRELFNKKSLFDRKVKEEYSRELANYIFEDMLEEAMAENGYSKELAKKVITKQVNFYCKKEY